MKHKLLSAELECYGTVERVELRHDKNSIIHSALLVDVVITRQSVIDPTVICGYKVSHVHIYSDVSAAAWAFLPFSQKGQKVGISGKAFFYWHPVYWE